MPPRVTRTTVDLSTYPDLVVLYLGMRAEKFRGIFTIIKFGPRIRAAVDEKPDGLLLHENVLFSLFPLHAGMRQYWRDFDALEKWVRTMPHKDWWINFMKDSGGTSFWHEAYFKRGGMEAIYDNVGSPVGFLKFAPGKPAQGPAFSARKRAGFAGDAPPAPVTEEQIYER